MLASSMMLARFAGQLKLSKFIPDEFVHGVFAPNSKLRAQVTPAKRGKRGMRVATATPAERHRATCAERSRSMSWAQRLKRVFQIEIERCEHCGGNVRIIGCSCASCARSISASMHGTSIEAPEVIERILKHLDSHAARGPPGADTASLTAWSGGR